MTGFALHDLGAVPGEEPPCDAGVPDRTEVDRLVREGLREELGALVLDARGLELCPEHARAILLGRLPDDGCEESIRIRAVDELLEQRQERVRDRDRAHALARLRCLVLSLAVDGARDRNLAGLEVDVTHAELLKLPGSEMEIEANRHGDAPRDGCRLVREIGGDLGGTEPMTTLAVAGARRANVRAGVPLRLANAERAVSLARGRVLHGES